MQQTQVLESHTAIKRVQDLLQSVRRMDRMPGREQMRRVEADADPVRAGDGRANGVQLFKPVSEATAGPRGVLQQHRHGTVRGDGLLKGRRHARDTRRLSCLARRSEERRVGKEWRSRWAPYH